MFKKVELVEVKNVINQSLVRGHFSDNLPGVAPFSVH